MSMGDELILERQTATSFLVVGRHYLEAARLVPQVSIGNEFGGDPKYFRDCVFQEFSHRVSSPSSSGKIIGSLDFKLGY